MGDKEVTVNRRGEFIRNQQIELVGNTASTFKGAVKRKERKSVKARFNKPRRVDGSRGAPKKDGTWEIGPIFFKQKNYYTICMNMVRVAWQATGNMGHPKDGFIRAVFRDEFLPAIYDFYMVTEQDVPLPPLNG